MRQLGYGVIDFLVDYWSDLPSKPATNTQKRAQLQPVLGEPIPTRPTAPLEVFHTLQEKVLSQVIDCTHPRNFAWVPSPSNFVSAMADALASGTNVCPGTWLEASGPAQVEVMVTDWLRDLCGFPRQGGGVFTSGGSVANLTALAAARLDRLGGPDERGVIYCSDQTHSSNEKNHRILGFRQDRLRKVATDSALRLDPEALRVAVAEDRAAGLKPFCVIANAGTTNAGAVDPLDVLADFCAAEGLWLHIDGAYGAAAVITDRGSALLKGLERADSITLDPHKWLFQPIEIGCCLVRDVRCLTAMFREQPEYLQETWSNQDTDGEINFSDRSIQLSRTSRALKLWASLKVFGLDAFRAAIDRGLNNAEQAEALVRKAGCFEVITPAQLGVVTFRYNTGDIAAEHLDAITTAIFDGMMASGYAMFTTTVIRGQKILRLCTINPRTRAEDLSGTVDLMAQLGAAAAKGK